MKIKFLNVALASLVLFVSSLAHAGLITDTTNASFIDETTGIEWMDFGVNSGESFNFVASELGSGGKYEGWALASRAQVYAMWANAYLNFAGIFSEEPDKFGVGQLSVFDGKFVKGSRLSFYDKIMGYNTLFNKGGVSEYSDSLGWFIGSDGLSFVRKVVYRGSDIDFNEYDYSKLKDSSNNDASRALGNIRNSTMLIKVQKVPEPSTLAIFALGMIGLASRRFKKQS